MHVEAAARKARSIEILKQYNIPYIEELPVIETGDMVKIRTKEEIAKRAIACLLTVRIASDMEEKEEHEDSALDIKESKKAMKAMLEQFGVGDCLTKKERKFYKGRPSELEVTEMVWKYEAYWALLWALGITEELSYPSVICDCDIAIKAVSDCKNFDEFMDKVRLRDIEEILDEIDLLFRYDWACEDLSIKYLITPGNLLHPVVQERLKACNWLIDSDHNDDWDNAPANT